MQRTVHIPVPQYLKSAAITYRVVQYTGVRIYTLITSSRRQAAAQPRSRASAHRSHFLSHMLQCIPYKVREAASERAYFILLVHILCISHAELRKLRKLLLLACTLAHLHTRHAPSSTTPHLRIARTSYLICYSIYRIEEASSEASIREVHSAYLVHIARCTVHLLATRFAARVAAHTRFARMLRSALRFALRSLHSPIHLPNRQRLPLCRIVPPAIIRRTGRGRGIVKVTLERVGPPRRDRGHLLHGLAERGVVRDR